MNGKLDQTINNCNYLRQRNIPYIPLLLLLPHILLTVSFKISQIPQTHPHVSSLLSPSHPLLHFLPLPVSQFCCHPHCHSPVLLSSTFCPSYHLLLHPHFFPSILSLDPLSFLTFFSSDSRSLKSFPSQILSHWDNKQAMQQVSCHTYTDWGHFYPSLREQTRYLTVKSSRESCEDIQCFTVFT